MSSPAYIYFYDALAIAAGKSFNIDLFNDSNITISSDSMNIKGAQFGHKYVMWEGNIHPDSMLFNPYVDHHNDCSSICIQMTMKDYVVSLSIDQSCKVMGDFIRGDIRVFHGKNDITDIVFPDLGVAVGTKDNMMVAMDWCNSDFMKALTN